MNVSTPNLVYLSSRQAIADLADLSVFFQAQLNKKHNKTSENAWFTFGCSYSGALAGT